MKSHAATIPPSGSERRPGSLRGRNPAGAFRARRSGRAVDHTTAVILPACDRDIAGLDGQDYYERQRLKSDSGVPVVSVLLQRANHNPL